MISTAAADFVHEGRLSLVFMFTTAMNWQRLVTGQHKHIHWGLLRVPSHSLLGDSHRSSGAAPFL